MKESDFKSRGDIEIFTKGEDETVECVMRKVLDRFDSVEALEHSYIYEQCNRYGIGYMVADVAELIRQELQEDDDD